MRKDNVPLNLRASVIIAAYNASKDLPRCLAALDQQTTPRDEYEVIVVDDGSEDDTAAIAEAAGARVLRLPHSGPATARNAGVEIARAPIVIFTDADCEPVIDFVERMLEPFAAPVVSGVRGVYRSQQSSLVARFVQLEYEERYRRIAHVQEEGGAVNALDTSYAAYRREVFLDAGGFDTRFRGAAGEDHELSYRLAQQGHIFRHSPHAAVYHRHVDSLWKYAKRKFRIGYWKAFLARQHPSYALADAHTTQSLKLQIGLVALLGATLLVWPFWPFAGWLAALWTLLFALSALPFLFLVARRDPAVLLVAPVLLFVRAISAGLGFFWGLLRIHPDLAAGEVTLEAKKG
ncbi:MAG: glycosyltransferase [Chloroflexi bacterium]|nr:glycosyltransferase [Chloroflexota bacterium]